MHRRRAWELRTAQERAKRPVSEGGRYLEPAASENVQRTASAPAKRLSGEPYTLPSDALEWIEALAVLRREVNNPKVFPFREHIARACEKTLDALRADPSAPPSSNDRPA
ncbi:hypothetical protein [Streptomyces sp. 1222.5]|uniref:hypothetical protein n=1 Tax=Streptomyces sp. 1222.5 TaxID=1881026 RepID=UPI003D72BF28